MLIRTLTELSDPVIIPSAFSNVKRWRKKSTILLLCKYAFQKSAEGNEASAVSKITQATSKGTGDCADFTL